MSCRCVCTPQDFDPEELFASGMYEMGERNLVDLQMEPWVHVGAGADTVRGGSDVRQRMLQEHWFRSEACSLYPTSCCGSCVRPCMIRCYQDVLHKVHTIVNGASQSVEVENLRHTIKLSNASYHKLLQALNQVINMKSNKRLSEYGTNPYKLDYAPIYQGNVRLTDGRFMKLYEPETGEVKLYGWPETGLCPFCLPRILGRSKR